jgi:4'-phosphopantetheinyl transferase
MKLYKFENVSEDTSIFAKKKLKEILQQEYNYTLESLDYNRYKKPYIPNMKLYFNISHSKDTVVIVIDEKEIGIDIEYFDRYNDKMISKIFNEKERNQIINSSNPNKEYSKLWCMKESYLKCLGTGIKKDMKDVLNDTTSYQFIYEETQDYCIVICKKSERN